MMMRTGVNTNIDKEDVNKIKNILSLRAVMPFQNERFKKGEHTLYFFSEWKKFCIGICKHFLQCFCHTGEPHTFKLTADFIVLCGKLVFIYYRYSSFPRKLLCSGSEDVVGIE